MMWAARDRRRLRMRLLLERCKVLRGLAEAEKEGGGKEPSSLFSLAKQDALRLEELSARYGIPIGQHLSKLASDKVKASAKFSAPDQQRDRKALPRKTKRRPPSAT